jgi:outer membrane protein OmpA-like peptidoglycan-associated protein
MNLSNIHHLRWLFLSCILFLGKPSHAQDNLLLNGNFEDINTCTEYNAECGVEAWFYLSDVKIQMLANEDPTLLLGSNSFGLYYNWSPRKVFYPVIGTILPCRLKKGERYLFRGMIKKEKLNRKLVMKPGIALGEKFYVPNRPFSAGMRPDTITQLSYLPLNEFTQFEYSFVATGEEKYLTFGTFIQEDTVTSRTAFVGSQTVNIFLDNFQLVAAGTDESDCGHFAENKDKIYNYNFRHKEMDYSLYGKGDLPIDFSYREAPVVKMQAVIKTDTLKLSDVLFDFNKSGLKPGAVQMLEKFFNSYTSGNVIDSICIEGHTDSIGSDTRNLLLSLERCQSVKDWLLQHNVVEDPFTRVKPFGKTRPVAPNRTAAGRALNRRVELIIFRRTTK